MTSPEIRIELPYRRKQTATIIVDAAPDKVFALMCPVREYEWAPGWKTTLILSQSGLVEQGCIFTTPAGASANSRESANSAIWVTPFHDPQTRRLTMIKVTPGESVTRLDIAVAEAPGGSAVTTSYEHTALDEAGKAIVDAHTRTQFGEMMDGWRAALSEHCAKPDTRRPGE